MIQSPYCNQLTDRQWSGIRFTAAAVGVWIVGCCGCASQNLLRYSALQNAPQHMRTAENGAASIRSVRAQNDVPSGGWSGFVADDGRAAFPGAFRAPANVGGVESIRLGSPRPLSEPSRSEAPPSPQIIPGPTRYPERSGPVQPADYTLPAENVSEVNPVDFSVPVLRERGQNHIRLRPEIVPQSNSEDRGPAMVSQSAAQSGAAAHRLIDEPLVDEPLPENPSIVSQQNGPASKQVSPAPSVSTAAELPGDGEGRSQQRADPNAAVDKTTVAASETPVTDNVVPREPTMFDRLRELYTPRREETPTEVLRKQFRRLQTPWGMLREREPVLPQLPDQSLQIPSADTVTALVPDEPAADMSRGSAVQPLIDELEAELKAWPRDADGMPEDTVQWRKRQTDLRLLYLIAERSGDAVSAIEMLPTAEQEFWQALMLAMTYYRTAGPGQDRAEQFSQTADQLRIAARYAASMSPLQIRRIAFCSAINSFGNIDLFPTSDFSPGQPVLIYAEVQNFRSTLTPGGTWHSEFAAVIDICRNDETDPVESIRVSEIVDESTSRRTDYFQGYELTIPQLARGHYRMRLSLRDRVSQQQTTASLEFNIR